MIPNSAGILCIGTKLRETERAIQFEFTEVAGESLSLHIRSWVPLSQIEKQFTNPSATGQDEILISEWIAKKIGLPL